MKRKSGAHTSHRNPRSHLRLLRGHPHPAQRDERAQARADAKRARRADLVEQRAADEPAEEQRRDRDDLVVARDDHLAQAEQIGVRHELAPHRRQHNYPRTASAPARPREGQAERRTGGGELRVDALPHDPLQAEARAGEAQRDEPRRVRPRRVLAAVREAGLPAAPHGDGRERGEERLQRRAQHEPRARAAAEAVADAPEERPAEEREDRRERLLVGRVEGMVVGGGAGEEACEGEGELVRPKVKALFDRWVGRTDLNGVP